MSEAILFSEAVTFWLDNKMSSGIKTAEIGSQILVSYRDKFYVVEGGAALMKGSRPLYYSKSSLPNIWKKAQRGILPPAADSTACADLEVLPVPTSPARKRTTMEQPTSIMPVLNAPEQSKEKYGAAAQRQPSPSKKATVGTKQTIAIQTVVATNCPYCNYKHEFPLEKGKNGRAFFASCSKCAGEFAVRFVPATVFQAQVAAFM